VREAGGVGLAQQGRDDAPDAGQFVAASGAGTVAVGAIWRRLTLLAALVVLVLALVGAGPLGPGTLAALLVVLGAPVLAAGVLAAAAVALAGASALAGAVGGLLAGSRAVDALAAGVIGLLEAAKQLGQVRQMVAVMARSPLPRAAARWPGRR
jgi:hypothetical protein